MFNFLPNCYYCCDSNAEISSEISWQAGDPKVINNKNVNENVNTVMVKEPSIGNASDITDINTLPAIEETMEDTTSMDFHVDIDLNFRLSSLESERFSDMSETIHKRIS